MKKIILLVLLSVGLNSNAQKEKGTVILKDNTKLEGLVKISSNKIIYKKDKASKSINYDYSSALSAEIINKENITTIFEFVPVEYKKTPLLLRVEIDGFLRLYSESTSTFNGVSGVGFRSSSTYHLKRKKDKFGQYYVAFGYIPKVSFNKVIEEYFIDCPNLQKKVKKGELKKNDYAEIVMFYNENCAPEE
ncbi:hypothetical protein [Flavobacterium okayamense]|uniref:Uncharacterized protein n=1 Tax=Flavobacterium okayamense TaxID=2830782 RepID=A0ABM7S8P9_9FLAO|nr:hypothetical protein [Flavobacterium okayamense]BCY27725.1 hypothetical protein KK2020170_05930 [Flavobacterium okayamense]